MEECGIYGYDISRQIEFPGGRIVPIPKCSRDSGSNARDEHHFHLTGKLEAAAITPHLRFELEAVLSFIEGLDVLLCDPIDSQAGPLKAPPAQLTSRRRYNSGGDSIPPDNFFPSLRETFINKALLRLRDEEYCERTGFHILFYKFVETFRQRRPFIEVTWFLLYSGLESFARFSLNDRDTRNSSEPITKLLSSFGFKVQQDCTKDLVRAVSTYTHIRNSLFHVGKHSKTVNVNGLDTDLHVVTYLFNFQQLVRLTIIKAVGFDDECMNWDSWVDRSPYVGTLL